MANGRTCLVSVADFALRVARRRMVAYTCLRSRHDFTQRQLIVCLALRAYLKQTYRGIVDVLSASPALCIALGLEKLPHYTTLQKFAAKPVVVELVQQLLADIIRELGDAEVVPVGDAAMDSTGFAKTVASTHFMARSGRGLTGGKGYIKVSVMILCATLLPCALTVGPGPRSDTGETPALLQQARAVVRPQRLLADRGFDAESMHEYCWEDWGVPSWAPPVIRSRSGEIKTPHRARMRVLPEDFGQRWKVESYFSGLKRSTGAGLSARTERTQINEAALRVLAYALRR